MLTRRLAALSTLGLMLVFAQALNAQSFHVTGTIEIRDEQQHVLTKDASQVAVWLEPLDDHNPTVTPSTYQPHPYQMVQHAKHFEPHLLVIPVGSMVKFPNLDPWFNNVFSLYRGKRFDLGLYQAGSQKTVQFDRPGPSYIFCNIHPQMSAVVLAVDSHLIGVSDATGHVSIPDVPGGRYRAHFWYEFAVDLKSIETREIAVGQENASFGKATIVAKSIRDERHKNKYGQDYDPENMTPEY